MKSLSSIGLLALVGAFVATTSTLVDGFLGCEHTVYPDQMIEDCIQKYYKNVNGATKFATYNRKNWDHPGGLCAFDGDAKKHGYWAYGARCLYGGFHPPPPRGDGGLMFFQHYTGNSEGEFPDECKGLYMTQTISFPNNKMSHLFPTNELCFLTMMDMSNNKFEQELPKNSFEGSYRHLFLLNLDHNKFKGSLEDMTFWKQDKNNMMVSLMLNNNQFEKTLPDMTKSVQLRQINVANNKFSGEIGSWFGKMAHLAWVELDNNSFTGPLPPLPASVSRFTADGNQFSGKIPESYAADDSYLLYFSCKGCNLECPSPDFLGHLRFSTHCKTAKSRQWAPKIDLGEGKGLGDSYPNYEFSADTPFDLSKFPM